MSDNVPTRIRIATRDLPRWAAVRKHIRQEMQSRPSIHRIAEPRDTEVVAEMLLLVAMHYRLPDPNIHYQDGPAAGDEANLAELMTRYLELGHRVEAHMNRVLGPAKHDDTD